MGRKMARSSRPIWDGPSSPMLTPTCEPQSLMFDTEYPAIRIWSWARVRKAANVAMNGMKPLAARPMRHADHVLLGDIGLEGPAGKASKNLSA